MTGHHAEDNIQAGQALGRATKENAILLVVDVQEKLMPMMQEAALIEERAALLTQGAVALEIPLIVTEQYVRGLGPSMPSLRGIESAVYVEKTTFSAWGEPNFRRALRDLKRSQVILCGIEAHICVLQTALDLKAAGYDVFWAVDASSSRLGHVQELAERRAQAAGIELCSVEGLLFELLEDCQADAFKAILNLVKGSR